MQNGWQDCLSDIPGTSQRKACIHELEMGKQYESDMFPAPEQPSPEAKGSAGCTFDEAFRISETVASSQRSLA
jgi:hypothetical protein